MKLIKEKWKWIAAAAGVILLAALLLVLLLQGGAGHAVVYAKGSEKLFLATPKGQFALQKGESGAQWFSEDGKRLFYDANGSLYLCEVKKSGSLNAGGERIAEGITQWAAADGFAVFIEQKGKRLHCHDIKRGTTEALASGVETLYAASGRSAFFFTKAEGEDEVLFRCEMGRQPERMTGAVKDVHLFAGEEQMLLFYLAELPTGAQPTAGVQSLYSVGETGAVSMIAGGIVEVFWEAYGPGGNLYFLQRGQRQAAASIVVDDPQKESDAEMKEPKKNDLSRLPILGRLLGDGGYSGAVAEYNKKQERDQARAAVEEILKDLPGAAGGMDCYVYYGGVPRLLAKDVRRTEDGADAAALRTDGYPAMVYKKEFFETTNAEPRHIGLNELTVAVRDGGSEAVREALSSLLNQDGTDDLGYTLAMLQGGAPAEVPMEQGFGRGEFRAVFVRGTDELIYLERGADEGTEAMYAYTLTGNGVSERKFLSTYVTDILPANGGVYYRKTNELMRYQAGESTRILQNAAAYFEGADGTLYVMGSVRDDKGTLYAQKANAQQLLAEGVKLGSAAASQRGTYAAWLTGWSEGTGTLYATLAGGKKQLDTGVTEIILVR